MATVYVTEFAGVARTQFGGSFTQVALCAELANQTVAIGGSSAQSAAFNPSTTLIRVHTDAICSVKVGGASPTATAANARMAANQTEYFGVTPGDKLAVITNT